MPMLTLPAPVYRIDGFDDPWVTTPGGLPLITPCSPVARAMAESVVRRGAAGHRPPPPPPGPTQKATEGGAAGDPFAGLVLPSMPDFVDEARPPAAGRVPASEGQPSAAGINKPPPGACVRVWAVSCVVAGTRVDAMWPWDGDSACTPDAVHVWRSSPPQ